MPHEQHHSCQLPADENATIWRYIDLAKFVSMLDHRALFFSQAARLADPFEGSYPEPTVRARSEYFRRQAADSDSPQTWTNIAEAVSKDHAKMPSWMYVNCWHLNEWESAAMWELYGQRGSSIAIRSTFARLRDSVASAPEVIVIGTVRYIDYAKELVSDRNLFNPFLCKRRSYAHEQELRALHLHDPKLEEPADLPAGLDIDCNIDTLIDTIYVSPGATSWFREVVTSITKHYDIDKPIRQSSLDEGPVYCLRQPSQGYQS